MSPFRARPGPVSTRKKDVNIWRANNNFFSCLIKLCQLASILAKHWVDPINIREYAFIYFIYNLFDSKRQYMAKHHIVCTTNTKEDTLLVAPSHLHTSGAI